MFFLSVVLQLILNQHIIHFITSPFVWQDAGCKSFLFHPLFFRELDNILDDLKKSNSWSPCDIHKASSVINVDSLDDSLGLPSPSERNIVAKVRTRSGIRRFNMKAVSTTLLLVYGLLWS